MYMLKLLMGAALFNLPMSIPLCLICFSVTRWGLQKSNSKLKTLTRFVLLLCMSVLTIGIVYGVLRFSGVILYSDDNTISYNWFDASWRDNGFDYFYWCGVALLGILMAHFAHLKGAQHGRKGKAYSA